MVITHIYLIVRQFCPNIKFPDKSSAELTRFDCNITFFLYYYMNDISVRQSPDRIGPAIFEVPKSPGDILTLND